MALQTGLEPARLKGTSLARMRVYQIPPLQLVTPTAGFEPTPGTLRTSYPSNRLCWVCFADLAGIEPATQRFAISCSATEL